jgi:hypothetical protein
MRFSIAVATILVFSGCKAKQSDVPSQATTSADTASPAATSSGSGASGAAESAVAPEVNPPGDIPDSQAFIKYASAVGGYSLDVPEGWARTENGSDVSFVSKFDGVKVAIAPSATVPTASNVRTGAANQIQAQGHAVTITGVSDVTLPAGKAVLIKYGSNSDPNAVTNKQLRLENEAYIYFKNGKTAVLTLWAPQGADNVDQWRRMSNSFRWR